MSVATPPVAGSSVRRRLSRGKLWLFRGLTLLLVIGILELASVGLWMFMPGSLREREALDQHQETVALIGTERGNELEALHPYLGWVINPDAGVIPMQSERTWKANSLGFIDDGPSVRKKAPDKFIVGVLGGSVAQQVTTIGEEAFRARLSADPALQGRKIEIVRLAMSGYKQPQQLMALNYVLALGAEFDVVVNIDGYNETALAISENAAAKLFIAYPRAWYARLQDVVDPRTAAVSNRLLRIRATRQSRAQWIVRSFLRRSQTVSLIWAAQDMQLKNQQGELSIELRRYVEQNDAGFARQGPHQTFATEAEKFEHAADLWRNSSLQMHHLCTGLGIPYLHFLQPNQYHEGSKPLSEYEQKHCYAIHEAHAQAAKAGYPRLVEAGSRLASDGVSFHDMTGLFSQETDTIYNDYFCHYNSRGTNMLAEAVADQISKVLQTQ